MSVTSATDAPARPNRATRQVLGTFQPSDLPLAAQQVLATVPRWWNQRAVAAGLDGLWTDVELAVGAPAISGIEVPWRRDLLDATPHALGEAYVQALDANERAHTGRHYTPQALAEALWDHVRAHHGGRPQGLTADPACGAGALLLPALRDWLVGVDGAPAKHVLDEVVDAVAGWDLDPAAVWLGSVLLAAELLPTLARLPEEERRPLPALLTVGDGLEVSARAVTNVVLNPPYGRVRLSPQHRSTWSQVLSGHANRYYLHIAAAVQQVETGGVVAALVPAGWLGGAYAKNLRAYLALHAPLRRLTYVRDRTGVFSTEVTQETVLAAFAVGAGADADANAVECDSVYLEPGGAAVREVIGSAPALSGSEPLLLPRKPDDMPLISRAQEMTSRLSTYGWSVRTGPLVWNRRKDDLSARPRKGSVKVVWAADIDGGSLHRDPERDAMRYVRVGLSERSTLVLERPAVLVQRTTSSEQLRRVVAAAVSQEDLIAWGGGIVVENHVNVLACADPASVLTPRILTALLDSAAVDRLYRCLSGSVAVSAFELGALPLPDESDLSRLASLDPSLLPQAIEDLYSACSAPAAEATPPLTSS